MDVIVDGERNFEVQGEPADVLSVVGAISDFLRGKGRALQSLALDGKEVTPDNLVAELEGIAPDTVSVLEVQSDDVTAMVTRCLKELTENLPELPVACRGLAEVFHGEDPEQGYEPFQELARIWGFVKTREALVANALEVDLDTVAVGGMPLAEMHRELNAFLEEAAQALQDGDCVLLGDLLEYELAPRAEQEAEIVALLEERAPSNRGG